MAQQIVGLDIGTWSIKAALIESTLRGFSLTDFGEHHRARDAAGRLVEPRISGAVAACLRELADRDTICTAFPGRKVMVRELELPFSDDKRIKSILGFQLEDQLPVHIDDLVYDYVRLTEGDDEGVQLLCAAVEQDKLGDMLEQLQEADADPRVVTLDTLTYLHLARHLDQVDTTRPVAMVDVGHMTTSLAIIHEDRVRSLRTIVRAGHHFTLALMRGYEVEYSEAERIKHEGVRLDSFVPPGVDPATHAQRAAMLRRPLDALVRDLRVTLHAYANRWGVAVDQVLVFGGSARLPGLVETLGRELGVAATRPSLVTEPWCQIEADERVEPVLPRAVALGLRHIEEGSAETINFRQGEFAYESDFKALRDRAGWLAVLLALLLVAWVGKQYLALENLEHDHAALVAELRDFSRDVLGEEKEDFDYVHQKLNLPPSEDDERVFPEISAFKVFYDVTAAQQTVNEMQMPSAEAPGAAEEDEPPADPMEDGVSVRPPGPREPTPPEGGEAAAADGAAEGAAATEDDGFQVELKQVQVDLKLAHIKGEANNIEAVEAFSGELKKHPCFLEVETNDTTRISFGDRQDWLRFGFRIDVNCAEARAARAKAKGSKSSKAKKEAAAEAAAADDAEDDAEGVGGER